MLTDEGTAILIEFYGVPRLRAGMAKAWAKGDSLGEVLRGLERTLPALSGHVILDGAMHPACKANLNGEKFISDPKTQLKINDVLILMSADVGG